MSNWNPARDVARAAAAARDLTRTTTPADNYRVALGEQPDPDLDRPRTIDRVSPEQQALNRRAELLRCPSGFGDSTGSMHWCPPVGDMCVRCGETAQTILARQETHA